MLSLPTENYLIELLGAENLDKLFAARRWLRQTLAQHLETLFLHRYQTLAEATKQYEYNAKAIGQRALKNRCLAYLGVIDEQSSQRIILTQFTAADNMTDEIAALAGISNSQTSTRDKILAQFYEKWQKEPLVVDKWLSIQAHSETPGALVRVKLLMQHPAFDINNPNKVRSLIGAFCQNLPEFHAIDGTGYQFLTDQIILLNEINPLIAARLVEPLTRFKKYDDTRQLSMRAQLEKLHHLPNLAKDIYEIVVKSLGQKPM